MKRARAARALRPSVGATLAALAAQYLLGMAVNLFVTITAAHAGTGATDYFSGVGQVIAWALGHGALLLRLRLHVGLGLLLVAAGIHILSLTLRSGDRAWVWAAAVGLSGIAGAAFNGASFLIYNQDFSSYIMATSFLIGLGAYALGLHVTRRSTR